MSKGVNHVRLLSYDNKIKAVRFVMDVGGCGIARAKQLVDAVQPANERFGIPAKPQIVAPYQDNNEVRAAKRLAKQYLVIVDSVPG